MCGALRFPLMQVIVLWAFSEMHVPSMMIAAIGTENGAKYDPYGEHMKIL